MAIGLVLDGGGAKGAYQIGVWKALRETGLDKNVRYIAGSSVGGLNAALFVQGDYEKAEYIWLHKLKELEGTGVFRLQMIVDKLLSDPNILDTSVFSTSPIECYMATYCKEQDKNALPKIEYTNGSIRKYTEGQVCYYNLRNCDKSQCDEIIRECSIRKSIMLATSALPLLCKSHKIDGAYHRDGGIKDNSPVKPLVYAEKCKEIFVIHLDAMKENINKSLYPDTTIYEIVPHRYLGGLLSGTINFSSGHINELFNAGYENTIALLERTVNTFHQQQKSEQIRIKKPDIKNRQLQSAQEIIALIDSVL